MKEARKEAQKRYLNDKFADIEQYSAFLQGIIWYKQWIQENRRSES